MEKVRLKDQFRGCMVGMAVGDALGAASEFMTEGQVRQAYGVLHDYRATSFFGVGEFTDDTSMALAIAESIIEADDVDIEDIAERFILWRKTDGRGIGILTDQVLRLIEDGMAPREASRKAWEASGRQSAGNGAVMRCAPVALYEWLDCTCRSIEDVCRITHYDSRCVASCAAVSKAISEMLHGESNPVRALYAGQLGIRGELYDALDAASTENVESMRLDGPDQGYTILTTRAAFAALRQFDNFEDGIVAVVNKGGDADTNACVAGALLGTRLGLSAIPERWVQGLVDLDRVLTAADGLYDLAVV